MVTETELFECRDLTPVQGDSGGKCYILEDDNIAHCAENMFI